MRIAIQKSTGAILEMQSLARAGTLMQNAMTLGYDASDIEEREVTPEEYEALLPPAPEKPKHLSIDALAALLVSKNVLSDKDVNDARLTAKESGHG